MKKDRYLKHLPTGNIQATALFIDVRNFLGISEILDPKQTSEFIMKVLRPLSHCIKEHKGYVCQIQGDAILAVFTTTGDGLHHAKNAVMCALNMQKILSDLNPVIIDTTRIPLSAGIGISSGSMYSCSLNISNKKDYTVIGKTVNLASRLQQLNRDYNTNILIDENVFAYIKDAIYTRKLERFEIKGSKEKIQVYEVLCAQVKKRNSNKRILANYRQGLTHCLRENWKEAIRCFLRIKEDENGYHMIERCKELNNFQDQLKKT